MTEVARSDEPSTTRPWDRLVWLFLAGGSVLRLLWPLDIEWKYDEKWMFATAQRIAHGQEPWPWVGMPSGVQLRNPGLSIWPFAALGSVFHDPVTMTQAIQWLNVLGLWALAAWVWKTWPRLDRALGLWSIALFAVSPLAVLFSRKIWAQDLLIVLVVPWLWGQRTRRRGLGAVLWGAFGALLGQLHMSGFFAAAALFVMTLLHDRRRFPWWPWVLGSVLGSLPMIPWLLSLLEPGGSALTTPAKRNLLFVVHALRHGLGLGLEYPLGRHYKPFLLGPEWSGHMTHLNAAARYGVFVVLGVAVVGQALRLRRTRALRVPEPVRTYLGTVALAGLMLIAARVEVFAHYLIVFGPLVHLGAAFLLYPMRFALIGMCLLQAFLSLGFAWYVHQNGGATDADFGKAYRTQTPVERRFSTE